MPGGGMVTPCTPESRCLVPGEAPLSSQSLGGLPLNYRVNAMVLSGEVS